MIRESLAAIKAHVLDYNTYFDRGYDDVELNTTRGFVVSGETAVFPADNLGDYFYLRLPDNISFSNGNAYRVTDCANAAGGNINLVLVAVVKNSDPVKVMENMIYTIQRLGDEVRITAATIDSAATILQELGKLPKANQLKALSDWNSRDAAISVTFTLTLTYEPRKKDCIVDPCLTC